MVWRLLITGITSAALYLVNLITMNWSCRNSKGRCRLVLAEFNHPVASKYKSVCLSRFNCRCINSGFINKFKLTALVVAMTTLPCLGTSGYVCGAHLSIPSCKMACSVFRRPRVRILTWKPAIHIFFKCRNYSTTTSSQITFNSSLLLRPTL